MLPPVVGAVDCEWYPLLSAQRTDEWVIPLSAQWTGECVLLLSAQWTDEWVRLLSAQLTVSMPLLSAQRTD